MSMAFWGEMMIMPPLIEELSKFLALTFSFHFAIIFTLTFAIIEFIHYMFLFEPTNEFILIRLVCIFSHLVYLSIQMVGFTLYNKTDWKGYIIITLLSAWILHVAWNGILGKLAFLFILDIM